jgi:hypothetical protein
VFCGNFEYDASERSIMELFEKYGRVDRIDMKTGECQVARLGLGFLDPGSVNGYYGTQDYCLQ